MRTPHRRYWLLFAALVLILGCGAILQVFKADSLESRFSRIQEGMTESEVDEILKGIIRKKVIVGAGLPADVEKPISWVTDEGTVFAFFSEKRLIDKDYFPGGPATLFERVGQFVRKTFGL